MASEAEYFLVMLPTLSGGEPNAEYKQVVESLNLRQAQPKKFPLPSFKVGTLDSLMEASDDLAKIDTMTEASLHKILTTGEQLHLETQDKAHAKRIRQELQFVNVVERSQNSTHPVERPKDVKSYLENWHWDNFRHTGVCDMTIKKLVDDLHKPVVMAEDLIKKRVMEYADLKSKASAAEKKVGGNLTVKDITEDVIAWNRARATPISEEVLRRKASSCEGTKLCMLFVAIHRRDIELWRSYASWGISDEQIRQMDEIKEGDTDHTADGTTLSRIQFKSNGQAVDVSKATASNPGGSQHSYGTAHDTGLPENALDSTTDTAWFDANQKPLIIDFGAPTHVDQFSFTTGTEAPSRDPVQWRLEGYTPASQGSAAPSATIEIEGVGQFVVKSGVSEYATMLELHKILKPPTNKRITLQEQGLRVQAVYDQLDDGGAYTYILEDGTVKDYSKVEEHVDLGKWQEVFATRNNFHTPMTRRENIEFLKLQKTGEFHKYRFTPTVVRGHPQRGPIPCGNGAAPGTSEIVAEKGDHLLMSVMVFSQLEQSFKSKCRDHKFIVREYEPVTENGTVTKTRQKEHQDLEAKRVEKRDTLLRDVKVQFSEAYSSWVHLKAVRAFVEAILRYGLPAKYVSCLFHCTSSKAHEEMRTKLAKAYADYAPKGFDLAEDANESNALQEKYAYVSLKIPSLD